MTRTINIVDYTPAWAEEFEDLRRALKSLLGELALGIVHVGSTSVPGLAAKPIIDIDVVIDSPTVLASVVEVLDSAGYQHEGDLGIPGRDAFRRQDNTVPRDRSGRTWPTHNLYVCTRNSDELRRHLAFRDHLRRDPESAVRYEKLKRDLAECFHDDIDSYVEGKREFIEDIMGQPPR